MRYFIFFCMIMTLEACEKENSNNYITLKNGILTAEFTPYGARLVSLTVAGRNVVWGFENTEQYRNCKTDPYYGATIGRYGNRIAKGKFTIGRKTYWLDRNDGMNSLHGGFSGFHNREWLLTDQTDTSVTFRYHSKDGEGGYPGNLDVKVTYTLTAKAGLAITYEAETDKPTFVNLTNHTFWNLNGPGSGNILRHVLRINADNYTPVDTTLIPTGIDSVGGTPLDFRRGTAIGIRINDHFQQLHNGKGYDHNYVLNTRVKFTPAAEVTGDISGIHMKVFTDQPGLQFYSGNFMAGKNAMNGGARDNYRCGFCLETQHFPNSPNEPGFPSTLLKPGAHFQSTTIYQFSLLAHATANN